MVKTIFGLISVVLNSKMPDRYKGISPFYQKEIPIQNRSTYIVWSNFIRIKWLWSAAGEKIGFWTQKTGFQPFLSGTVVSGISKIGPKPLKKPFVFYPNKIGLKSKYPKFSETPPHPRGGIYLVESTFIRIIFRFLALWFWYLRTCIASYQCERVAIFPDIISILKWNWQ